MIEVELHGTEKNIVKDSPFCTVDGEQQCAHSTQTCVQYVQETKPFSYWGNSENANLFSANPKTSPKTSHNT